MLIQTNNSIISLYINSVKNLVWSYDIFCRIFKSIAIRKKTLNKETHLLVTMFQAVSELSKSMSKICLDIFFQIPNF